jgi:hypothetical protein
MTKFSPPLLRLPPPLSPRPAPLSVVRKKTWLVQSADFEREEGRGGEGRGRDGAEGRFFGYRICLGGHLALRQRRRRRRRRREEEEEEKGEGGREGRGVGKKFVKLRDRKKEFAN